MLKIKTKKIFVNSIIALMIFSYLSPVFAITNVQNSNSIMRLENFEGTKETESTLINDGINVVDSDLRISLSLRDSDVQQVLRMLADKAKLNVIFHESATGKVTLDLVDVSLNDAFKLVFGSCELSYYKEGTTLFVVSKDSAKDSSFAKQTMTVIPIKYVNATNVASFLNDNVFGANLTGVSGEKVATSNPRTNEVMIFGTKNDSEAAKRVIEKIDTKPLINRFKVSHTTPKEMANLICKTMFAEGDGSASGEDAEDSKSSDDTIVLGGGSVACKAKASGTGSSEVFQGQAVSIVYMEQNGEVGIYGGSYHQAELIKDFIIEHDKKQPMAYLEINILELNEIGSRDFSTAWGFGTPFGNFQFDSDNGVMMTTSSTGGLNIFQNGNWFPTISGNGNAVISTLQWIVKNNNGRVLSNPKVMATNGQLAKIDLSSDYIESVDTDISYPNSGGVGGSIPIIEKTYNIGDENGIVIELVPFISPDGYVSLNLKPEYSSIKETVQGYVSAISETTGELTSVKETVATLLQRRNLELKNVRIKDNETLILAGFIQEVETQTTSKIPILGDLPLIGPLFRSSHNQKEKVELVIMITPHLVYSEDDIKNLEKVKL